MSMQSPNDDPKDSFELYKVDKHTQDQHHQAEGPKYEMKVMQKQFKTLGQDAKDYFWSKQDEQDLLLICNDILDGKKNSSHLLGRFPYRTPAAIGKKITRSAAEKAPFSHLRGRVGQLLPKGTTQGPSETTTQLAEGTGGADTPSVEARITAFLDAEEAANGNALPEIIEVVNAWVKKAQARSAATAP